MSAGWAVVFTATGAVITLGLIFAAARFWWPARRHPRNCPCRECWDANIAEAQKRSDEKGGR